MEFRDSIYFIGDDRVTEEEYTENMMLLKGYEKLISEIIISFIFTFIFSLLRNLRYYTPNIDGKYIYSVLMFIFYVASVLVFVDDFRKNDIYALFNFYYYNDKREKNLNWLAFANALVVKIFIYIGILIFGMYLLPFRLAFEIRDYSTAYASSKVRPKDKKYNPEKLIYIFIPLFVLILAMNIHPDILSIVKFLS